MLIVVHKYEDEGQALADAEMTELESPGQVVGIYKVPTIFCETVHGKRVQGYTQGQKWGWWVCGVCKRPKKTAYLHMWDYMSNFGWNLIDRFVREGKLVAFTKRSHI